MIVWWCDTDDRWTWVNVMFPDGIAAIAINDPRDLAWAIHRLYELLDSI